MLIIVNRNLVNLTRQEKYASVFDAQDKQRRLSGGFCAGRSYMA